MSKYPKIEIKEQPVTIIDDGFSLEGSYQPSYFGRKVTVLIEGYHHPRANGHLVVYETIKKQAGLFCNWECNSSLVAVLEPDVKKEDVIPQFRQRLEDRLRRMAEE